MKFTTTLLAVRDMERALSFYRDIFGQKVVCDLGWNKTLTCGLTLQEHFDRIADFPEESILFRPHDMELYFETEDMDGFIGLLDKHPEVERMDQLRTYPWHQRGTRIYDPDGHLIEISESMESVAFREFRKGLSIEETSAAIQHPAGIVANWYEKYKHSERENTSVRESNSEGQNE